jgi:hypothetical protein
MKNEVKIYILLVLFTIILVSGMIYLCYQRIEKQNQILDRIDHLEGYLRGVREKRYTLSDADVHTVLLELSHIQDRDVW